MHCMYQCPSDLVVDEMDGRTRYLLRYGMVRYYLWAEKGCLYVGMYACTCAGLGWAVLCGAVLGWAGRCCAVRCGAGFIVGV